MTAAVAAVSAFAIVVMALGRRPSPRGRPANVGTRDTPRTTGRLVGAVIRPVRRLLDPAARRLAQRRQDAVMERTVEADLPELIDLLILSTAAGLTIPASLPVLARWGPRSLADPLRRVSDDIDRGRRATDALDDLAPHWGDPARPLIHAMVTHLRDGTPLAEPLARVGHEARLRRQRAAETRARRLPVLLLFPLVFCVLPAFGLLTVAPLVAGTLRSLHGETVEASASHPLPPEVPSCPPSSLAPSPPCPSSPTVVVAASRPPSTPWCCWVLPPSPSSSWPGPGAPMRSPDSSTW